MGSIHKGCENHSTSQMMSLAPWALFDIGCKNFLNVTNDESNPINSRVNAKKPAKKSYVTKSSQKIRAHQENFSNEKTKVCGK